MLTWTLRGEDEKTKLGELKTKFGPLMKEVLDDKCEKVVSVFRIVTTSEYGFRQHEA